MAKRRKFMTENQFSAALIKLGFNQQSFARTLGCNDRTVRSWISGRLSVPRHVSILLRMMITQKMTPEDVEALEAEAFGNILAG